MCGFYVAVTVLLMSYWMEIEIYFGSKVGKFDEMTKMIEGHFVDTIVTIVALYGHFYNEGNPEFILRFGLPPK